jgi:hypothetical protein
MFSLADWRRFKNAFLKLSLGAIVFGCLVILPHTSAKRFAHDAATGENDKIAAVGETEKSIPAVSFSTRRNAQNQTFVGAANGAAFVLKETANGVKTARLKTSKPVFKAFGLTSDKRKLLYTALRKGAPTGELYLENLSTGKRQKVASKLVLDAALSPTDDDQIAYTFAGGESFGLAVARLDAKETKILLSENVYAEKIQWSDDGEGIHYFAAAAENENLNLVAQYVPVAPSSTNDFSRTEVPGGFPVAEKSDENDSQYKNLIHGASEPEIYKFRVAAPGGAHEVAGDNLLGSSVISALDKKTGEETSLGKGQLVKALPNGVVIKEFSPTQTELSFVDWSGNSTSLAVTTVNYNLPLQNSTMIQGGSSYAAPGNCGITAHTGAMDFAYDFQSPTVGAHVLAAADGLVVFNTSSVACNTIDTDSCADYSASGCPGTYLGNVVIIQHADGTYTKYAHLQLNSPQVAVGTNACRGLYIGRQGHTGSTNGTFNGCGDHLHFQRQTSPDIFGQAISVDFTEAASPLACGANYVSSSTEVAHSIAANSQSFGVAGGNGSVSLTSTGCVWEAKSNDGWITITSAVSGSGNSVVNFTVADNSGGSPRTGTMNLGGHIFTVTQSGVQPPNQAPTANAGADQTITLPSSVNLNGAASDDGLPNPPATLTTAWSKISGPGTVIFGNANSLNTTASFGVAGIYVLRLTASDSALTATDDLTVTVNTNSGGGSLSGTLSAVPANVNLSSEGTADWAHWGLTSATSFNRKNNATQQISNYTQIGTITPLRYTNNASSYTWTGGTPTASASGTTTGVYVYTVGNGFQITVPADTAPRTLKIYAGVWAAGGYFEATLSDGSASPFTDTSIISTGVQNGVYALNYRAASAGQSLTVRWLVNSSTHPVGNVTLQAATLTVNSAPTPTPTATPTATPTPTPNQSPTANAGADQTITLPANANLSGAASDDGLPNPPAVLNTSWSKVSGQGTVTFTNANSLNTTASFSAAGVYVLRLTASDSALNATDDVSITVNNPVSGGGMLSVSSAAPPANVNLANEGTADWAHWGLTNATSFNRKNGVAQQISNYAAVGNGAVKRYTNNPNTYSWTGGTPTASANNTANGIYVSGVNNGFQITVPADATPRTLKLYVGLWSAGGKLEASLSDNSAPTFVDTSLLNSGGTSNRVFTLNFQSGSAGQTLTVKWTASATFSSFGNVTLQAATLVANNTPPPVNQPPSANAGNDQTITLPNTATLSGAASDDGLPNPPAVLTTTWSKISGPGTVTFGNANSLNTTASFSAAGVYVLRLTASDSLLSASDDVTVTVNASSGGTGTLSVASTTTPTNVNLTNEGTADWAHWGLISAASINRKNNVTQKIGNYTAIGGGTIQQYGNNTSTFSWSDGTPTANQSGTATGVYVIGANNGFQITVPADATPRTLKLYVGLWAAGGKLEATLSDGSAPAYIDASLVNSGGTSNRVYLLNYQAASAGQTLTVKWTVNATFNSWSNVTLQAAALIEGGSLAASFGEFEINAAATNKLFEPHSAAGANGSFIATWLGCGRKNGAAEVYDGSLICGGNPL